MDSYNKNEGSNYVRAEKERSGRPFYIIAFILFVLMLVFIDRAVTTENGIGGRLVQLFAGGKADVAISGNVSSVEGDAILMASVTERDSKGRIVTVTFTDPDGNFSLVMKNTKNTLVVRASGYVTQKVRIGSRTAFDVRMEKQ